MLFQLLSLAIAVPPPRPVVVRVKQNVTITASIGENCVTIYGYTSPSSRVELTSTKVFAATYSDPAGYYIFDKTILPKDPGELCLSSLDDNSRRSTPVCIPAPPATNYFTNTGPILLPPTITLDSDNIKPGATTIASGQSIPGSQIDIYLYQVNNSAPIFPKSVQAFGLPVFSTVSDSTGNYNFNLPTAYSSDYRLYSTVKYLDSQSPKSNTLTYLLPSLFWLFWQQNSWLIITLAIFVITLTLFFYLIYIYYLAPPSKRYLPAIFSYPLMQFNPIVPNSNPSPARL
jgi:hypothetical protein